MVFTVVAPTAPLPLNLKFELFWLSSYLKEDFLKLLFP
jgi:hypothetical protein